jgi:hypothetical protein
MKKLFLLFIFIALFIGASAQIQCVTIEWNAARTEYTIIKYNATFAFLPVQGLNPDFEVLVKRTPFEMPDYDSRLVYLVVHTEISEEYDTEYPTQRMWVTTYSTLDKPLADMITSVDEAENDANYQVMPTQKQLKYMVIAIALIDKKVSGLTLTPLQQNMLDRLQAKAVRIWINHVTSLGKKAELEANGTVDLDSDWENIDPENEQ